MNFTREPIIETIIMPKEGYKLLLRNSKVDGREEVLVDAVEVVSFGHSFFFRALEKPKSVLLPVMDYEVEEVREHRTQLRSSAPPEKIKIGGGAAPRAQHRPEEDEDLQPPGISAGEPGSQPHQHQPQQHNAGKRGRRRNRRRHRGEGGSHQHQHQPQAGEASPTPMPNLIPPPSTLISDTMSRYKETVSDDSSPGNE